jgi:hypothetical protein
LSSDDDDEPPVSKVLPIKPSSLAQNISSRYIFKKVFF